MNLEEYLYGRILEVIKQWDEKIYMRSPFLCIPKNPMNIMDTKIFPNSPSDIIQRKIVTMHTTKRRKMELDFLATGYDLNGTKKTILKILELKMKDLFMMKI